MLHHITPFCDLFCSNLLIYKSFINPLLHLRNPFVIVKFFRNISIYLTVIFFTNCLRASLLQMRFSKARGHLCVIC